MATNKHTNGPHWPPCVWYNCKVLLRHAATFAKFACQVVDGN